jgi:hypothetical protein
LPRRVPWSVLERVLLVLVYSWLSFFTG